MADVLSYVNILYHAQSLRNVCFVVQGNHTGLGRDGIVG